MERLKLGMLVILLTALPDPGRSSLEPSLEDILTAYFITDIQGSGQVQFRSEGSAGWERGRLGTRLEEGDRILVGEGTQAVLSLKKGILVHLDGNSEMTIETLREEAGNGFRTRLKLWTGDLLGDVGEPMEKTGSSFEVGTEGVVCGAQGTVFEIASHGGTVETAVRAGRVHVQGGDFSRDCGPGQTCRAAHGRFQGLQRSLPQCARRFAAWERLGPPLRGLEPGQAPRVGAFLPLSGLGPTAPPR
ncbi:MAG TPA: FecR family protein [bacterium]|nr:FecR family protein [bacterium]